MSSLDMQNHHAIPIDCWLGGQLFWTWPKSNPS